MERSHYGFVYFREACEVLLAGCWAYDICGIDATLEARPQYTFLENPFKELSRTGKIKLKLGDPLQTCTICTMSLLPLSPDILLNARADAEKNYYNIQIAYILDDIYKFVVYTSMNTPNTVYYYPVNALYYSDGSIFIHNRHYYMINIEDVFAELRKLFPGCRIGSKILHMDTNYDIYNFYGAEPSSGTLRKQTCIMVDWTPSAY